MADGVLITGFSKRTRQTIIDQVVASLVADINPNLNTTSTAILGQLIGTLAQGDSEGWDVLEEVYDAQYPDSASDASLDNVASLTGATRLAATKSTATLTLTGDNTTLVPSGSQARVPAGGIFETTANATIVTASIWTITTAYSVGDIRSNDSPLNIYIATVAGTSAGSGGPTGTGTAIVDGTVTWRFLGDGEGIITAAAEATVTGPVVGSSFQITEIVTAVSGWLGVNNQADAAIGTDIEKDAAFRVRRLLLLAIGGRATVDAIRAALLGVTNVTEAFLFENPTDVVDSNGLPAHSIEPVAAGGTDVAVATSVFDNKAAGIETFGADITEVIVDAQGTSHTINGSRSEPVEMFIDVIVIRNGNYPTDGDTQVENALKAAGDLLTIGQDVIFKQFESVPLERCSGVSGVVDISLFELDKRPVTVTSANTETFTLSNGETLTVKVDGQTTAQTVTFLTGDFADIANALASEVAAKITSSLTTPAATGGTATGAVTVTSDSGGTIEVTGGTANAALGFPTTFDPTGTANVVITSRQEATFDTARITVSSVPV